MLSKVLTLVSVLGLVVSLSSTVLADGDPEAGKTKSATCAACHGVDGNSVNPEFPKIAGQVPGYIAKELAAFKDGSRPGPVMGGLVLGLSEQDMQDLDAYYAQFEQTEGSINESELAMAKRGQELYRVGASEFSIPACMACHGPAGNGIPSRYPKVSGQYKSYLVKSLLEFKSGDRVSEEMNTVAFRLSIEQIEELATYMQGLN